MNNNEEVKSKKSAGVRLTTLPMSEPFLGWIRTSIALMGFGFVIVKFALFIREISIALGDKVVVPGRGYSAIIGVIMVGIGAVMGNIGLPAL